MLILTRMYGTWKFFISIKRHTLKVYSTHAAPEFGLAINPNLSRQQQPNQLHPLSIGYTPLDRALGQIAPFVPPFSLGRPVYFVSRVPVKSPEDHRRVSHPLIRALRGGFRFAGVVRTA